MDVAAWLRGLGLERYEQLFRDNDIDAEVLGDLTERDLETLGVSLGHRKRLLKAIAARHRGPDAPAAAAAADAERRQVAVLFADLAGFTRLSAAMDAEDVHAILDRFLRAVDGLVASHGGFVDKHIGDCVMALFGAPTAHSDDAERAARTAVAIHRAMVRLSAELGRELRAHVGIGCGEVVASTIGSEAHRSYTVTGETVNVASRLADRAAAGETLIDGALHGLLQGRVEAEKVGELELEGLERPVAAWRVTGFGADGARPPGPFVGRRAELARVEAALALSGGRRRAGALLYVRGEAGIGKTCLADELLRRAAARGFATHKVLVLDFGVGQGRDAIRSLVRRLVGVDDDADEAARRAAAEATARARRLPAEQRAHLHDLLDLRQPAELLTLHDAMENAAREGGRRAVLRRLVRRATRERPLLVVVEDVHWAKEPATRGQILSLAAATRECPLLLTLTSRSEDGTLDVAELAEACGGAVLTVDLGPLRADESALLARRLAGTASEFVARCVERAGGHPLFLEQLLRTATEANEAIVPGSIRSVVLARMDALPARDRRALQAASALGQRFDIDGLRAVAADPDYDGAELVRRSLIHREGGSCLFAHALIRDGVYGSLVQPVRRGLHARAAAWFEGRDAGLFAAHLDQAGDRRAPAAYLAAARQERAAHRHDAAARLIERGRALARAASDRFDLASAHGEVLTDLGAAEQALGAFEDALAVASDEPERCRARIGLAGAMRLADRCAEALAQLDAAAVLAATHRLTPEAAEIHHLRANLFFPLGRIDGCHAEHGAALRLARSAGSVELEAKALGGLGDADYARGRMASAAKHFEACVALCAERGLGRIRVANFSMIAHCLCYQAAFERGREVGREAVRLAREVGHWRAEIVALNGLVNIAVSQDRADAATAELEREDHLGRRFGARRFAAIHQDDLAAWHAEAGRLEEARGAARRALRLARESGVSFVGPKILAHLAALTEDAEERAAALTEGERLLAAGAVGHNHLWFRRYAIEATAAAGDWSGTLRHADALDAYTSAEPLPWAAFWSRCGRALALIGRGAPEADETGERLRAEALRLTLNSGLRVLARLGGQAPLDLTARRGSRCSP